MAKSTKRTQQTAFLKPARSDYGGDLQKTRAGRAHERPLSKKSTMHLVMRSTMACGERSLLRRENKELVRLTFAKFSKKYGVKILALANVGNHLHLQIRITNRATYNAFIRAVTGAIALGVLRRTRGLRVNDGSRDRVGNQPMDPSEMSRKFWDYRPFSRIAKSFREYLNLQEYVRINQIESAGYNRHQARNMVYAENILNGKSTSKSLNRAVL